MIMSDQECLYSMIIVTKSVLGVIKSALALSFKFIGQNQSYYILLTAYDNVFKNSLRSFELRH